MLFEEILMQNKLALFHHVTISQALKIKINNIITSTLLITDANIIII